MNPRSVHSGCRARLTWRISRRVYHVDMQHGRLFPPKSSTISPLHMDIADTNDFSERLKSIQDLVSNTSNSQFDATGPQQRDWEQEIEELEKLVALLPLSVRTAVEEHPEMTQLLEVVLDLGRPPLARFPSGDKKLSLSPVTKEDLEYAIAQVGDFGGDNRAGIDRTLHRISCMRNRRGAVVGLTCRVGRAIWGSAELVRDIVDSGASILFLGRPGVGKTTAIREVSRTLSDTLKRRVVIVDTSNEIGGDGDIPHDGIGRARRMQVRDPEQQHRVMVEAVENHTPEVIIIDEIGTEAECVAARTIAQRGVQLVATAHGNELENLVKNPSLTDLVGGIQSVTLGDEEAKRRGVQKSVLERAAPPTFDVAVEMLERGKWKVHLDVAQAVDNILAGGNPGGQIRERTSDGTILKATLAAQRPGMVTRHTTDSGSHGASRKKLSSSNTSARKESELNGSVDNQGRTSSSSSSSSSKGFAPSGGFGVMEGSSHKTNDAGDMGEGSMDSLLGEEEELICERALKLRSWQAARGVVDDAGGKLLKLLPFDLDPDSLWEVMTALNLIDKIYICEKVSEADAILGLRPQMRTAAALKRSAKRYGVPIYVVKNLGAPVLARALRTLLGVEPSLAGAPQSKSSSYSKRSASQIKSRSEEVYSDYLGAADHGEVSRGGAGAVSNWPPSPSTAAYSSSNRVAPYSSMLEEQALEEAEMAVELIVKPQKQPVELLPRAPEVIRAQQALLDRYQLKYEVVGEGVDARIRILPPAA
ncbi:hypothetical protein CEUSTIGMA_g10617.t1 [Chlamydomonas eustigma]|uniref:AAA+ ATPase domain-containing protein n=1 Tax=Chlamydomonas eustigma TaxID=1157962 RepID=A0A250XJC6_9CHLO|nr:hypothetical protein CEUSTIGMA_g10617.t1 [Chlamydomonas eustigma]|eukprot:GAX83191.1 hypothetical protein CEUSTIGMA_g10617.t1 [Chlamydomonas eustigma]